MFDEFPYHQTILHRAQGDFVPLPGWHEDISGVRSIGDDLAERIETERRAHGPYRDLTDFALRTRAGAAARRSIGWPMCQSPVPRLSIATRSSRPSSRSASSTRSASSSS